MSLFKTIIIFILSITLASCQLSKMGGDARKNPPDPRERVKKNLEEGKGFRIMDLGTNKGGGTFEFASSDELACEEVTTLTLTQTLLPPSIEESLFREVGGVNEIGSLGRDAWSIAWIASA